MRPGSRRGKRSKQASAASEDQVRLSGRAKSPNKMDVDKKAETLVKPENQDKEDTASKEETNHKEDDDEMKKKKKKNKADDEKPEAPVEIKIDPSNDPNEKGDKEDEDEKKEATNNTAEIKIPESERTPPPTTPPRPMADPLTPIEHGSLRGDDDDADSSSPLTERSLASDLVAPKSLQESLIKKAIQTAEKSAESEGIPKVTVEETSPTTSVDAPAQNGQLSDSSSLSEPDDVDSEAETERLEPSSQRTPRKKSANLIVHSAASSPSSTIHADDNPIPATPSPTKTTMDESINEDDAEDNVAEAEAEVEADVEVEVEAEVEIEEEPEEDAEAEEAEAEAKTTEPTTPDQFLREPSTGLAGKKRKRSFGDFGEMDQDVDPPVTKETEDTISATPKDEDADGDTAMKDDDESISEHGDDDTTQDAVVENGVQSRSRSPSVKDEDEKVAKSVSPKPKKRKNKKSRTIEESSNGDDDPPDEPLENISHTVDEGDEDNADAETEAGVGDNDHDNSRDDDADAEMQRIKKAAADEMTSIELIFAQLRDKLVEERVGEIDREIAMINDGTHPELILMSRAIQERRDYKIRQADTLIRYQREANERETIALKAHVHAQYYQDVRDARERILSEANEMWYAIHKERRAVEMNNHDYIYKVPKQTSVQYKHRAAYNNEVSLLSGIAKFVGFPAAPGVAKASIEDTRSDLEAMGLSARIPQLMPQQQPIHHMQNLPAPQLTRPQVTQQPHPLQQSHIAPVHQPLLQQSPQSLQQAQSVSQPGASRLISQQQQPAIGPIQFSAVPHGNQKSSNVSKRTDDPNPSPVKRPKTPVSPLIAPHPVPAVRQHVLQVTQSPEQLRSRQVETGYEANHVQPSSTQEINHVAPISPHFVRQPQLHQLSSMHLSSLLGPVKAEPSSAPAMGQASPPFNTRSPGPNRVHSADSRNHAQQQHHQQQPLPPLSKHVPRSPPPQHFEQRDAGGPLSLHGRHSPPVGDEKLRTRIFGHDVGGMAGSHLERRVKEEISPVGPRFGPPLGRPNYA